MSTETVLPDIDEITLPDLSDESSAQDTGPYVVILYNDDYHPMPEVVSQLQKATGYDIDRCVRIMLEAHTQGRAIAYTGSSEGCERVANVLRQIGLQVETDRY